MSAFWLARSKINEPVAYKSYTALLPDILSKHLATVLARWCAFLILSGPPSFHLFLFLVFPFLYYFLFFFLLPSFFQCAGGGRTESFPSCCVDR